MMKIQSEILGLINNLVKQESHCFLALASSEVNETCGSKDQFIY